jgi:hypothetical protein
MTLIGSLQALARRVAAEQTEQYGYTRQNQEDHVPKATVRRGKLTIPLSGEILAKVDVRDGDELEVTSEDGRIVLTPVPEEPQPGELEALGEAERELVEGKTRRLDDILYGMGRKIK